MSPRLLTTAARAVLLLVSVAMVGCSASGPPPIDDAMSLTEKLEVTRRHLEVPGAVVAVQRGNQALIRDAYGVASLESEAPMTTDHRFRVASLTKPFIATILLQLVDEGRVSLDDPISAYLDGVPAGDDITLRMLAQHTSGLRNYIAIRDVRAAFAEEPTRFWTERELLRFAYDKGPHFEPQDNGWVYSNTNYILLGQLIEHVEQRPLNDVIQDRICRPLGMDSTFYSVDASMPTPYASGYQYGDASGPNFWVGKGDVAWDVTETSPSMWHAAGALVSTLDDVLVFIDAVVAGDLVSEASHAEQMTWRESGYSGDYSYGLGLINYMDIIGHNGNMPGYQVTAMSDPKRDLTVVVLTNLYSSPNYEEPANAMFFVIMRHLTGRSYAPPGWGGW